MILSGLINSLSYGGHDNLSYWIIQDLFDPATALTYGEAEGLLSKTQSYTYVQPSANGRLQVGTLNKTYVDDYYERIHILPNPVEMGNLLSEQTRSLFVWNAYFTPKSLDSLTGSNLDGIDVAAPTPAPTTFQGLEEREYVLNISTVGPPAIDGSLSFSFEGVVVVVGITGQRVVLFRWRPTAEVTEKLEWKTNILQTRVAEQRIGLRTAPRQFFSFGFVLTDSNLSDIKTAAQEFVYRSWGCPMWHEQDRVTVAEGSTLIALDTTTADYRDGGLLMLWESEDNTAALEIDTVTATTITLKYPAEQTWSNAIITPLRLSYMTNGVTVSRMGAGLNTMSVDFRVADNITLANTATYPTYKGYDVLSDGNILMSDISERIIRPVVEFDNGSGPIVIETTQDYNRFGKTVGKLTQGREELWDWRTWLHSRYGRQKAFWLPTWASDFTVITDVTEFATTLDVRTTGAATFSTVPFYIMIQLESSVLYREVTNVESLAGYERLTIDSAIGEAPVGSFVFVCRMSLCRFDSDNIEIVHNSTIFTTSSIPAIEVPDGV